MASAQSGPNSESVNSDSISKKSIVETIKSKQDLSLQQKIELYRKLKKESPDAYNFENEDELTMYGYGFLWSDMVKEAIEVFKLILAEFPDSSNAYDSLGEAYLQDGQKELALSHYAKSFAMDPNNFNAADQVAMLKDPSLRFETAAEKFDKTFSVQEYREDLDQLGKRILEVHPFALKFISKEDFWKLIEAKKTLMSDNTTYSEFNWHCSEIIASIGCSHTSVNDFYAQTNDFPMTLRFPLQTRLIDGHLFVIDPMNNKDEISIKDEITSINKKSIAEITSEIYRRLPSQGKIGSSQTIDFNRWATSLIPFALGLPSQFEVTVKGNQEAIMLKSVDLVPYPVNDGSIAKCEDNLCLEFVEDNIAVMTISSFNYYSWNNLDVFLDFMDKSFNQLHKKDIQHLIIDLRKNGGGSPESSIHLLKYLVESPFEYFVNSTYVGANGIYEPFENRYENKLYFLIDGNGKSTTGHFMAMVKDRKLGTIIGEELGSNHFCTGGQTVCRLSNTRMVYYLANSAAEFSVKSLADEKGVLPDHFVTQGIEDYLGKVDYVKNYTLNLIKEK